MPHRNIRTITHSTTVSQTEIEFLVGLQDEIVKLTQIYHRHAGEVFRQLRVGAAIEPGPHTAKVEHHYDGPLYTAQLVVR